MSAFLIAANSCKPDAQGIKVYTFLVKPEECTDFRGPGCYRYDDNCKLIEYLPIGLCHQYLALSPDDARTVLELAKECGVAP